MSDNVVDIRGDYILRRGRYWFIAAILLIPVILFVPFFFYSPGMQMMSSGGARAGAAAVYTSCDLLTIGWAVLFLIYAINSRMKTLRVVLFVMAGMATLYTVCSFALDYTKLMMSTSSLSDFSVKILNALSGFNNLLYIGAWLVCSIIILAGRDSTLALRLAAGAIILAYVFSSVCGSVSALVVPITFDIYITGSKLTVKAFSLIRSFAVYMSYAGLLTAVSFSRMKRPKEDKPAPTFTL